MTGRKSFPWRSRWARLPKSGWVTSSFVVGLVAAAGFLATWAPQARAELSPPPSFTLPASGPVIQFRRVPGELAPDQGPEVRVFADGRVVVHRSSLMTRPGRFEGRLELEALHGLLDEAAASGLFEVAASDLQARRRAILEARARDARRTGAPLEVHAMGARDLSRLEIRLGSYTPSGQVAGDAAGQVTREWSWHGLHADAALFPELAELVALDRLEHTLLELVESQDLEKLAAEDSP